MRRDVKGFSETFIYNLQLFLLLFVLACLLTDAIEWHINLSEEMTEQRVMVNCLFLTPPCLWLRKWKFDIIWCLSFSIKRHKPMKKKLSTLRTLLPATDRLLCRNFWLYTKRAKFFTKIQRKAKPSEDGFLSVVISVKSAENA